MPHTRARLELAAPSKARQNAPAERSPLAILPLVSLSQAPEKLSKRSLGCIPTPFLYRIPRTRQMFRRQIDGDGARCQSLRATATSQQSDTLRSADGETPQATSGTLASSNPVPPGAAHAAHAASEAALVHPHPQSLHHKDSVDVPTGIRDSAPVSTDVRVLSCRIFDPSRNPLD